MSSSGSNDAQAEHAQELHDLSEWRSIEHLLANAMKSASYPDAAAFAVKLAMEEAIVNGIKHGNQGDVSKSVKVAWHVTRESVSLSVEDEGPGFQPEGVPDPRDPDLLEVPGGRGLLLMRAYMHEITHNERGNRVTMTYRKPTD